jgi:multiple sugar transport system substrate-binding protein
VWGVPWYVDTRLLFYRTDLLARAGYDAPPRTWDAWRKAMEDVKAQAPDRYAIFLPTNEWAQPVILGMQAGSPLLKDGGRYGAFTDSAYQHAFDFYISLFRDRLAPPAGNNDIANVYQEFERGLFAMYITGPWNIGEFARRLPPEMQDKWATAPLPSPRGDSIGVSMAGGSSLVVFRRSEHPDEAWRLVEYLSRPDVQFRFFQLTGDLPARLESWQDSSLIGNRYAHAFWEQLQHVEPLPKVPEWENIATKLYQSAETVIRGNTRPADALARLQEDVDQLLEKRRWLMARAQQDNRP